MLAPMVAVRGINRNLDPQPGHLSIELHLLPRHFTWSREPSGEPSSAGS
jgi:hypothetical protein